MSLPVREGGELRQVDKMPPQNVQPWHTGSPSDQAAAQSPLLFCRIIIFGRQLLILFSLKGAKFRL